MPQFDISDLEPFDPESGCVNVVIETPRGLRTKFKYDEKHGLFMFDKALPIGQSFPFDFGFLPSTRGEDGDPLDVLLLAEEPTFVGCLVLAKLLGVIEAEQTQDGKTNRNDRFVAVPVEAESHKVAARSVEGLGPATAENIVKFFIAYNELQGKKFKALRCSGPDRAIQLIEEGLVRPRHHQKKKIRPR